MSVSSYIIYATVTLALGGGTLWWLISRLQRAESQRRERLERLKRFDAIRTASPLDDPTGEAREIAIESVVSRFTILRRLIVPSLCLLIALLLIAPFLEAAPATLVSLIVAVVGVVVGIAAKPALENLFAGVVISFSRPIRIGDTVRIDDLFGTVEDISITHTTIKIWDWRRYMIPNSRMVAKEFINYSIVDRYQWVYVEFWVSHEADITRVREIAIAAASQSPCFANYEPPRFWVMELAKEGLRCWVAAWADTPSAGWQLAHDTRTELVQRFQAEGIRTHSYRHELTSGESLPVEDLIHARQR